MYQFEVAREVRDGIETNIRRDDAWQLDDIPRFWFLVELLFFLSPIIIPNGQRILYYCLVKFHIDLIICLFLSLGWHYQLNDHVVHALFEKWIWLNQVSVCMEGTFIFPFLLQLLSENITQAVLSWIYSTCIFVGFHIYFKLWNFTYLVIVFYPNSLVNY